MNAHIHIRNKVYFINKPIIEILADDHVYAYVYTYVSVSVSVCAWQGTSIWWSKSNRSANGTKQFKINFSNWPNQPHSIFLHTHHIAWHSLYMLVFYRGQNSFVPARLLGPVMLERKKTHHHKQQQIKVYT